MTDDLSRRVFIGSSFSAVAAIAGCAGKYDRGPLRLELQPSEEIDVARLATLPDELLDEGNKLLAALVEEGWLRDMGWPGAAPSSLRDPKIFAPFIPIPGPGYGDFHGQRLIHPGRPDLSALYHASASPKVRWPTKTVPAGIEALKRLDRLEDIIYGLEVPSIPADWDCRLAVLAYEYRPAADTPHGCYADMVFSRTGIGRIGSEALNYDPRERVFTNLPADPTKATHFAVTAARFGLFLVHLAGFDDVSVAGLPTREKNDANRIFLRPLRKISNCDPLFRLGTLAFESQHRSEQLARLVAFHSDGRSPPQVWPPCDLEALQHPPFLTIEQHRLGDSAGKKDLVRLESIGSSVLVSASPAPLVRYAKNQKEERIAYGVPAARGGNRRYTTYKLEAGVSDALDAASTQELFRRARTNEFRAPRNAPLFANMRYEWPLKGEPPVPATHESSPFRHIEEPEKKAFEKRLSDPHWAALFEDGLCDGCVWVRLPGVDGETSGLPSGAVGAVRLPILPAFSLVTAPDFFPNVAPMDLDGQDTVGAASNFLAGGTAALSLTRVRANRWISLPYQRDVAAFSTAAEAKPLEETVTSVVSLRPPRESPGKSGGRKGTLPDVASAYFFPGWDVSYSSGAEPSGKPATFLATMGLGSPFPEDMKLCAVANGMWPASSPDATRTFQGGLKDVAGLGPSTSVPLLDEELGFHPGSPAATAKRRAPIGGWDGEHGPFLEEQGGQLFINYADINRVDYVENALDGRFDASKLRHLTTAILIGRMDALRRCTRSHSRTSPRESHLWLVSAEHVSDWSDRTYAVNLPERLRRAILDRPPFQSGSGLLYVFAEPRKPTVVGHLSLPRAPKVDESVSLGSKRRRQSCHGLFVGCVSSDRLATMTGEPEWLLGAPAGVAWSYE